VVKRLLCLAVALAACKDHEQLAVADGEAAQADVARACASAPAPGASDDDPLGSERTSCAKRECEARCAHHQARTFRERCVSTCTHDSSCLVDTDCGPMRCVTVAPRVRRCRYVTSHTPGSGSAP
jgi:hypothetical protein